MTLLLRFGEFILCFLQLLLEGRVGMQGRHHRRATKSHSAVAPVSGSATGVTSTDSEARDERRGIRGFLQLLLEGRVGMQGRHHRRADYPRRIDVALPMIAADNPAFAQLIAAFENFVLPLRIDLRQYQR
jgi:hypothetical protein